MAMKPVKVSQLNNYIKRILSTDPILGNVSVIGEISNIKFHSSGHVYFTLKDENSKINCFLPSDVFNQIRYQIDDGMEITASGYIYLYEKGGTYSLNVRDIQLQGVGNLSVAFFKLKEKLSKEGIFDDKYKKSIPVFPKKIAVITSETGAAVQDIIKIIKSRNNYVDILVYPVIVQGKDAACDISNAINDVNMLFPDTDIIITGRGGGSSEELWAFNEEIVARAIFASKIPIISAVGHETDFTIADFVSDKRAETPTAAAAMAAPDINDIRAHIEAAKDSLVHSMDRCIQYKDMSLQSKNVETLYSSIFAKIELYRVKIDSIKANLLASSPVNIMKRGYAAILDDKDKLRTSALDFNISDNIVVVFSDGKVKATVDEVVR